MPTFPSSSDELPFIVTTPSMQSVESNRKTIRSHAVRGRNRKKRPAKPPSWINGGKGDIPYNLSPGDAISITPKVGGEFSFTAVPIGLGPEMLNTIWRLRNITPSLEFGPASGPEQSRWIEPVLSDVACFHFTMFISKMYLDHLEGHNNNTRNALVHHTKALNTLQRRLSAGDLEISTCDSTVLTIVGLATAALAFGDVDMAQKHLGGLQRMVSLRGGISAFEHDKRLETKLCRVDLGVALSTGSDAFFFPEGLSWSSYLPSKAPKKTHKTNQDSSSLEKFLERLDARLRLVWDDLKACSQASNMAAHCGLEVDTALCLEVMVSIHYRLIRLRFDPGTVDETIRLALLAFASSVFLQGGGVWVRHEHLYRQLKNSFFVSRDGGDIPRQVMLWLCVFCVAFDTADPGHNWLQSALAELLRSQGLKSWNEVRGLLKSVIWVDKLHDAIARNFVEAILDEA